MTVPPPRASQPAAGGGSSRGGSPDADEMTAVRIRLGQRLTLTGLGAPAPPVTTVVVSRWPPAVRFRVADQFRRAVRFVRAVRFRRGFRRRGAERCRLIVPFPLGSRTRAPI